MRLFGIYDSKGNVLSAKEMVKEHRYSDLDDFIKNIFKDSLIIVDDDSKKLLPLSLKQNKKVTLAEASKDDLANGIMYLGAKNSNKYASVANVKYIGVYKDTDFEHVLKTHGMANLYNLLDGAESVPHRITTMYFGTGTAHKLEFYKVHKRWV